MRKSSGRGNVLVTQQLLHSADVIPCFQQLRAERMAQRMRSRRLGKVGGTTRRLQCTREDGVIEMMAAFGTVTRITGSLRHGEHILPSDQLFAIVHLTHRSRWTPPAPLNSSVIQWEES